MARRRTGMFRRLPHLLQRQHQDLSAWRKCQPLDAATSPAQLPAPEKARLQAPPYAGGTSMGRHPLKTRAEASLEEDVIGPHVSRARRQVFSRSAQTPNGHHHGQPSAAANCRMDRPWKVGGCRRKAGPPRAQAMLRRGRFHLRAAGCQHSQLRGTSHQAEEPVAVWEPQRRLPDGTAPAARTAVVAATAAAAAIAAAAATADAAVAETPAAQGQWPSKHPAAAPASSSHKMDLWTSPCG
mmetsp:Transcript_170623/g.547293  ORF Transcript_170623/g.547293 Transcript_170623/m.547293 type:complete len:240 (-) Transcript_170623:672-1391(-)